MGNLPFLSGDWLRLAAVCRRERVERSMTLASLSDHLGLSLRDALQFEAGSAVSLETLVRLEQTFGWCLGDTLRILRNEGHHGAVGP